jgi:signal transduction histidine kinase
MRYGNRDGGAVGAYPQIVSDDTLRWWLPAELGAADAGAIGRRTVRDWAVDAFTFCGAALIGLVVLGIAKRYEPISQGAEALDLALGALACLSLWWRRRFPLAVAWLAVPAQALSTSAVGAGAVIVGNLALRVTWRRSIVVLCVFAVSAVSGIAFLPSHRHEGWGDAAIVLAYYLVFFAWGGMLRARRSWLIAVRKEAERERADHARRLAEARRREREAIAREMHDVLAHRISLLSVHAGALAYRTSRPDGPELSRAEVAASAQIIRDNGHQALEELQEVLRVLRADDQSTAPQPRMVDLPNLVDEARASGQSVAVRDEVGAADTLRPNLQRTVYRVVQEGLTNARKHAPGAPVTVRLTGAPGDALIVEVGNPLPAHATPAHIPGAGAGLVGLAERVELDGGRLDHGSADGAFTLRARLPWPAR